MIRIFIGYDHKESIAAYTLMHSIWKRSSMPVSITPLWLNQLQPIHSRPRERFQSNDFTFSRWLVPYLCGYQGWAIFMDCDMLMLSDVQELWSLQDYQYAVQVVKNDYKPIETVKYLGNEQDSYHKKNWSSVMLMNCEKCKALTPEYIEWADRLTLHQFQWLTKEELVGDLPLKWNHLVGYGKEMPDASLVHFTKGGPYFKEFSDVEFTDEWRSEFYDMTHCQQLEGQK